MENIKQRAQDFLGDTVTLPIDVEGMAARHGWDITTYGVAVAYITAVGLEDYAQTKQGFCMIAAGSCRIFVSDGLGYAERRKVIAHEIGHIILGHTSAGGVLGKSDNPHTDHIQEQEADAFALALLAPVNILAQKKICTPQDIGRRSGINDMDAAIVAQQVDNTMAKLGLRAHKRRWWLAGALVLLVAIGVVVGLKAVEQGAIAEVNSRIVLVTKSGDKYHRSDCQHVLERDTTELTIAEAEKRGKHPCAVCEPEED